MAYGDGNYGAGPYGIELIPGDYGSGAYGRGPYGVAPPVVVTPPGGGGVRADRIFRIPQRRYLHIDEATGRITIGGYGTEQHHTDIEEPAADHIEELLLLLA